MSQYINIAYKSSSGQESVIEVLVNETPTDDEVMTSTGEWEKVPKKGTITLSANAAGFGWMASLITDFLLDDHPEEIVYQISEERGLSNVSPTLIFQFDAEI